MMAGKAAPVAAKSQRKIAFLGQIFAFPVVSFRLSEATKRSCCAIRAERYFDGDLPFLRGI
jgi:hypothetical protein